MIQKFRCLLFFQIYFFLNIKIFGRISSVHYSKQYLLIMLRSLITTFPSYIKLFKHQYVFVPSTARIGKTPRTCATWVAASPQFPSPALVSQTTPYNRSPSNLNYYTYTIRWMVTTKRCLSGTKFNDISTLPKLSILKIHTRIYQRIRNTNPTNSSSSHHTYDLLWDVRRLLKLPLMLPNLLATDDFGGSAKSSAISLLDASSSATTAASAPPAAVESSLTAVHKTILKTRAVNASTRSGKHLFCTLTQDIVTGGVLLERSRRLLLRFLGVDKLRRSIYTRGAGSTRRRYGGGFLRPFQHLWMGQRSRWVKSMFAKSLSHSVLQR